MVVVDAQRPLSAFEQQVLARMRRLEFQQQGGEVTLAFHARGKESFWELKTTTYERFRTGTERQFLAVE